MSDVVEDAGIRVEVPSGWEGLVYRREPDVIAYDPERIPAERALQPTTRSVLHLASFPLPEVRGDYGSGAVEIMRDDDILVILFEFEPESATTAMFAAEGIPGPLRADDFDPNQMQRPLPGMAGVQRFFNIGGERAFVLFVVIGSYRDRQTLVRRVNDVLAGIEIS